MLMTKYRSSPARPVRARSPHSMMIAASKSPCTRPAPSITSMPGTPGNASSGSGARSALTTRASLPIARSAYAMASADPIESPSGLACDEITNRCFVRSASTIARNGAVLVRFSVIVGTAGGVKLVEDALDPVLAFDRFVVGEFEIRRPLEAQARANLPPQERRGPFQRARARGSRRVVAERGVEDARQLQV